MAKLVLLKFDGSLESGFQVGLEIGQEGQIADINLLGNLPPAPELMVALATWQNQYSNLDNYNRIKPQQIIYDGLVEPDKQLKTSTSAHKLQAEFQQWLESPSFYRVDKQLREALNHNEAIRVLIGSDRSDIALLPWCCWDLLENYPNLEIGMSNRNYKRVPIPPKIQQHNKVRILAILGDGKGLNLAADFNVLKSLKDREVVFLHEPSRDKLYAHLWQTRWDIVFFAGHSKTIARQGVLYINQEDSLTIEDIKYAFARAIASGLQLAIFNSCDGLGIAEELSRLSLPQSIVMRMPIPDEMAQEFIKHFLQAYTRGHSLYLATKMARQQLQAREDDYPYACWLPTIYQNPAIIPPNWADLRGNKRLFSFLAPLQMPDRPFISGILTSAIALMLVCLIQSWGWLEARELRTYDHLMNYRMTLPADNRVLVVTIDDSDIGYQREQGMRLNMRGSLADMALDRLIKRLQSGGAKAIASDVIHDFPFEPDLEKTIAQTDNFFAICRVKINPPKIVSIHAPSTLPKEQIGFSNLAIDDDGAIRRQILGMSPDEVCQSSLSLSLRLALKYLDDIPAQYEPNGILQIGSAKFPKLKPTSGGYHLPEAKGYQILLNYRQDMPETITLQEALTIDRSSLEPLVQDKIVLIGVAGHNQDLHHTPYSQGRQSELLPGVIIHAQMTSSIISTVLGEQKLLWWLGDRWELLWIALWSSIGSGVAILGKHSSIKLFWGMVTAMTLIFGCSWILFLNGGWLIAIAPCFALLLSAAIASIYVK